MLRKLWLHSAAAPIDIQDFGVGQRDCSYPLEHTDCHQLCFHAMTAARQILMQIRTGVACLHPDLCDIEASKVSSKQVVNVPVLSRISKASSWWL